MNKHVCSIDLFENSTGTKIDPFQVEVVTDREVDNTGDLEDKVAGHIRSHITSDYPIFAKMVDPSTIVLFEDDGFPQEIGRADVTYKGQKP